MVGWLYLKNLYVSRFKETLMINLINAIASTTRSYRLAAREAQPQPTTIRIGEAVVGGKRCCFEQLFNLLAGDWAFAEFFDRPTVADGF